MVYGQDAASDREEFLTLTEVRRVETAAMEPVWDVEPHPEAGPSEGSGSLRERDIHRFPGGMTPPSWVEVPEAIADWVRAASHIQPRELTFCEDVARLHCAFEQEHPFLDDNERTGRLVLKLLLVRLGLPPAIVFKSQREQYLRALRRGNQGTNKFVVPAVARPARLVPITALGRLEINAGDLRAAAVRRALQATKGTDGHWRSCRNWVDDYLANRHQRR